jgi:hypothetical protein
VGIPDYRSHLLTAGNLAHKRHFCRMISASPLQDFICQHQAADRLATVRPGSTQRYPPCLGSARSNGAVRGHFELERRPAAPSRWQLPRDRSNWSVRFVRCMGCGRKVAREELQNELGRLNAGWLELDAADAPDGDADLQDCDFTSFSLPACQDCDGLLKLVVFFDETVLRNAVDTAADHLQQADAMLIVGSSLVAFSSGFRFVQMAARAGIPIAAVNLGRTRADELLTLKVEQCCESALAFLL